jgi:hypothetical protein
LKAGVSNKKGRKDPTQMLIAKPIFKADLQPGDRDVGAIEKCDGAENEEKK